MESIGAGTQAVRKTIRSLFTDGTETYPDSSTAKITARGNKASATVEYVTSKIGGISPAQNSLLGAPAFLACTTTSGFSGRWLAEKVASVRAATISNIGVSIYNSYGARKIKLAIYSSAGALLGSTALTTISAQTHGYLLIPLSLAVSLVGGAEYWLCIFGDGIDLPSVTTPANLNSSLSGAHSIDQPSATDIPTSLTLISPQQLSSVAVPLWGG
jgi:hypothetical protein